jgi:uncharacterized protein YecE (DUF72 family)
MIRIGTAGWSIPRQIAAEFPTEGSSLERYAARFSAAEINSSFHRPHRISTWERWRNSVAGDFRFSVKLPKVITHQAKLQPSADLVTNFLDQAHTLGEKLAVLLVQLPPKLELDVPTARAFFTDLGRRTDAPIACEPRNPSWFTSDADAFLEELRVARVAADPPVCEDGAVPGGWRGLRYWRLHGSPTVYRSSYMDRIPKIAEELRRWGANVDSWCIFDNTASSAGAGDALALARAIGNLG